MFLSSLIDLLCPKVQKDEEFVDNRCEGYA
jgi:hypothetical protein